MATLVDLANDALGQIGHTFISNLDDGDRAADLCNRFLEQLIDATLRRHKWNFAILNVELALDEDAELLGYAHAYTLPADCLRVLQLNESDCIEWQIEGRTLVTDETTATIKYISRIQDPNVWDSLFYQALSAHLASKLAIPLAHDFKMAVTLYELFEKKISEARAVDGQEGTPRPIRNRTLTNVRKM